MQYFFSCTFTLWPRWTFSSLLYCWPLFSRHEPWPESETGVLSGNSGACVWSLLLCLSTEGMLTLRAKPPTEAEFIDSLQKLKLALNLLVRYRSSEPPSSISCLSCSHSDSLTAPPTGQTQETHTESKRVWAGSFPVQPAGAGKRMKIPNSVNPYCVE